MDEFPRKTLPQIADEYRAAPNVQQWLLDEVADYLLDDVSDAAERATAVGDVLARLDDEGERFSAAALDADELVLFSVTLQHQSGEVTHGDFSVMASPVLLLDTCASSSRPGDVVVVKHLYASGEGCEFAATWPFGMDLAVAMTTPMAETLAEDTVAASGMLDMLDMSWFGRSPAQLAMAAAAGLIGGIVIARRQR